MAIANTLTNVAMKVIKQFGRTVTLTTSTPGDYNADTGESSITATSTITVFLGAYSSIELRPGLIEAGDIPIYTVTPIAKDDKITIESVVHSVTSVQRYYVEASVALYVANIRRI
jgi:hypothetical protein